MKKRLAWILVLVLAMSLSAPAFAELDLLSGKDIYPLDGSTTVSWYVNEGYELNPAYAVAADSPFHVNLQKMTGVNIDWSFKTIGADTNQALNLALASDPLPDILFGQLMPDAERHIEEGTIIDLTELIPQYAPAYWHFLQSNPAYDKAMKTDSGKYYGFGFFREDGGWNDTYQGPVIRQDWLTEQGLKKQGNMHRRQRRFL